MVAVVLVEISFFDRYIFEYNYVLNNDLKYTFINLFRCIKNKLVEQSTTDHWYTDNVYIKL